MTTTDASNGTAKLEESRAWLRRCCIFFRSCAVARMTTDSSDENEALMLRFIKVCLEKTHLYPREMRNGEARCYRHRRHRLNGLRNAHPS